jgi:hypothetical protein
VTARTAEARDAHLRVLFLGRPPTGDPVADADHQTAMADARAALCLATGVPPELISPLGYNISDESYERVKASWVYHIGQWGWSAQFDGPYLRAAFDLWRRDRPDLAVDGDWFAPGVYAHVDRYPGGCGRQTCDICRGGAELS